MTNIIHPLDPVYKSDPPHESGEGHFIVEIFCVNQDGGDFSIMRDVEYQWKEVPDGIEVWAILYEDFTEHSCGVPEDINDQVSLQIGEHTDRSIMQLNLKMK